MIEQIPSLPPDQPEKSAQQRYLENVQRKYDFLLNRKKELEAKKFPPYNWKAKEQGLKEIEEQLQKTSEELKRATKDVEEFNANKSKEV